MPFVESLQSPPVAAQTGDSLRLLGEGQALQSAGYYRAAVEKYRQMLTEYDVEPEARAARFLLAEALMLDDQQSAGSAAFADFLARYPDDDRRNAVTFRLARSARLAGKHDEAIRAYSEFRAWPTAIDGYVSLEIGKALLASKQPAAAIAELNRAAVAGLGRLATIDALESVATAYDQIDDNASALIAWQRIAPLARTDSYKAEVLHRQATYARETGQNDVAADRLGQLARLYPRSGYATSAVSTLLTLGADPGAYQRGVIAYWADREADAVRAFDEYLRSSPNGVNAASALQMRGLSKRYLGQTDQALADFAAVQTNYPTAAASPDALFAAGQLLEAVNRPSEAVVQYQKLIEGYPTDPNADEALLRVGFLAYDRNELPIARTAFQRIVTAAKPSVNTARAGLWLGKILAAAGDPAGAEKAWVAAASAAPDDFFGLRARSLRLGETVPGAPFPANAPLTVATATEYETFARWIGDWAKLATTPDLSTPGAPLMADPAFIRVKELLHVGLTREASDEILDLADRLVPDPVSLGQLAVWVAGKDLPRATSGVGDTLARSAPLKGLANAPRYVQRLAMPLVYPAIVLRETRTDGVDPLLLMALMRQESQYDRYATSPATARGLTQVMPATGEGIAKTIGMANYAIDDLYRPEISIDFGSYYLAEGLKRANGNAFVAMAAYNAGPAGAAQWTKGDPNVDPDIFYERISYRETQSYVRLVGTYYYLYRIAYRE